MPDTSDCWGKNREKHHLKCVSNLTDDIEQKLRHNLKKFQLKYFTKNLVCNMKLLLQHWEGNIKVFHLRITNYNQF